MVFQVVLQLQVGSGIRINNGVRVLHKPNIVGKLVNLREKVL